MKRNVATIGVLTLTMALVASPAAATVNVWLDSADSFVEAGQTIQVQLMASFSEPMMGWGIDLGFSDPTVAQLIDVSVAAPWNGSESLDHDYLAGLTFPNPVSGISTLATLTFEGVGAGTTVITMAHGPEEDEGFLTAAGPLDYDVTYQPATIQVVPEPASLVFLVVAAMFVHRRQR